MQVVHVSADRLDDWIELAERTAHALTDMGARLEAGSIEHLVSSMKKEQENG